jgi:hypothetical protein
MIQLDPVKLKLQAAQEAGRAEFGEDAFAEFYDRFVGALNTEGARLTPLGVQRASANIVRALRNRLLQQDWLAREPAIGAQTIDRPILLMGLPRSGTTFMHHLFDHDPDMQLLRFWETLQTSPPPATDAESVAQRLAFAHQMKAQALSDKSDFDSLHLLDPDGPDECTSLLDQVFGMVGVLNLYRIPGYFQWLADSADFRKVYAHHKSVLQHLQWQSQPRRWVLKYPNYIMSMAELRETYPGGLFVVSHRDPVQTLASLCKLTHVLRSVSYDEADNTMHQVGQDIWHYVQTHVDHMLKYRCTSGDTRIVDVDYRQLVENPTEVVQSVYTAAGMAFPDSVRDEIADWTAKNPKGKRGVNSYNLEDYGLDRDAVEAGFSEYRRAFDIPLENA